MDALSLDELKATIAATPLSQDFNTHDDPATVFDVVTREIRTSSKTMTELQQTAFACQLVMKITGMPIETLYAMRNAPDLLQTQLNTFEDTMMTHMLQTGKEFLSEEDSAEENSEEDGMEDCATDGVKEHAMNE